MMPKIEKGRDIRPELDSASLLITIDGPSSVGKDELAHLLAERYGLTIINTGQMIRAIALLAHEQGLIKETDHGQLLAEGAEDTIKAWLEHPLEGLRFARMKGDHSAHVFFGDTDMTPRLKPRTDAPAFQQELESAASAVAANTAIRQEMYISWVISAGAFGGAVVIGRKTGVEPFGFAHEKVVLKASIIVAAWYRFLRGAAATDSLLDEIDYLTRRDGRDGQNNLLRDAPGAMVIDTTEQLIGRRMQEAARLVDEDIATKFTLRRKNALDG